MFADIGTGSMQTDTLDEDRLRKIRQLESMGQRTEEAKEVVFQKPVFTTPLIRWNFVLVLIVIIISICSIMWKWYCMEYPSFTKHNCLFNSFVSNVSRKLKDWCWSNFTEWLDTLKQRFILQFWGYSLTSAVKTE